MLRVNTTIKDLNTGFHHICLTKYSKTIYTYIARKNLAKILRRPNILACSTKANVVSLSVCLSVCLSVRL